MKFFKFGGKKVPNVSKNSDNFDNESLEADFFCQLAYMAAIATSGISRRELFYHAAKLPYTSSRYFRRVDFVAKMFNHDYAQACRIVGEQTKEPPIKAFLLRFSGTLAAGEDIVGFLSRESAVLSEAYGNSYERKLELLKKWSDAYVSLILTSALVTVMSMVAMMIGNISIIFMGSLTVLTIGVTIAGSWLLYRTAPRESMNHSLTIRSHEQQLARNMARFILPLGGICTAFLLLSKAGLGSIIIVASIFLFLIGIVAIADDRKVSKRDSDIAAFLRSLGGVMQAIGTTAAEGIGRLDFRSLGVLKEDVKLLHHRLAAGINPNSCWKRFIGESGSELINRSVTTFWDGISLGGEPQEVGNQASSFALKVSLLRAQRSQIAVGFTYLTVAMHAVLITLSIFTYSVFITFSDLVQGLLSKENIDSNMLNNMSNLGFFNPVSVHSSLLYFMVITVVFVLTLADAFAIYAVSGGHPIKLIFYLALTTAISGAIMAIVPPITGMLFHVSM